MRRRKGDSPTKNAGGEFTATPTEAIPFAASQELEEARGGSDTCTEGSLGLGTPSELDMSSKTKEASSDPGEAGTGTRSKADMVVGTGPGGEDGAISGVGLGSTENAEPSRRCLERGKGEAAQISGRIEGHVVLRSSLRVDGASAE